ncbi:hypothetical protein [Actinomyces wuliandei]|uniref:hypothetical protein n=1 Tax=Actinomyces wuliandei TaxID=2057743 RepID=UPI000FDB9C83|nr:hypothetical protein [Actinomyces wuliandei]
MDQVRDSLESDEDILCAVEKTLPEPGGSLRRSIRFHPLPGSWRAQDWQQGEAARPVSRGKAARPVSRGKAARPVSRGEAATFLENPAGWDGDD